MSYDTPIWEIRSGFFTGIKGKLSLHVFNTGRHACREIMLSDIAGRFRTYHAKIKVLSCYGHTLSRKYPPSEISMTPQSLDFNSFYQNKDNVLLLEKLLMIVIGTLSVCLYHNEDDSVWRLKSKNYSPNLSDSVGTLTLNLIPPGYLSNPISASLILGVIRDCYNLVEMSPKKCNEFISLFDYKEVSRIVKNTDYQSAKEIYFTFTEPFLLKNSHLGKEFIIRNGIVKKVVRDFIDNGFKHFIPQLTCMYWCSTYDNFGFDMYVRTVYED